MNKYLKNFIFTLAISILCMTCAHQAVAAPWTDKVEKTTIADDDLLLLGDSETLVGTNPVNKTLKYSTLKDDIGVDYFGYSKNTDNADLITYGDVDTYQIYIPLSTELNVINSSEFSYNELTGEITYLGTGTGEVYSFVAAASIEGVSGTMNGALVHFSLSVNGVTQFESSATLEGLGAMISVGGASLFSLNTGDVLAIRSKSTVAGTANVYHMQWFIIEINPAP